jgi:MFS family permease
MSGSTSNGIRGYWHRIRLFSPNARKYMLANTILGFAYGVSNTIFNLYLLALGYTNAFLGGILSISFLALALSSLAVGSICIRIGAKRATIIGVLIMTFTALWRVWVPIPDVLMIGAIIEGVGYSLTWVAYGPFLSEHSASYERTHLFGTTQALNVISGFVGNTFAGIIPVWVAITFALPIDSAPAFQLGLISWIIPLAVTLVPLLFIRDHTRTTQLDEAARKPQEGKNELKPVEEKRNSVLWIIAAFTVVYAILGIGAGFIVPFLNVFFWDFYSLPTPIVGLIQGLGSATVALGAFLAPMLSTRIGKARAIMVVQTISLPFLVILATIINPFIAGVAYILRQVFMTAGIPIDGALQMELVPISWRTHLSAMITFSFNFALAISVQITGQLYDLGFYLLPFWFTLICYSVGTILYFLFYKPEKRLIAQPEN